MSTSLKIGLFGFGVVGQGLWTVLQRTPGLRGDIVRICVKDRLKERSLPTSYFTYNPDDILDDPDVNVVVELIDDADAAFVIVSKALRSGKAVVSANKRMIAEHFEELLELQKTSGSSFLYEASVCGSIPIIRNLEEYYDNDLLSGIDGIVNGTTNYILTKMTERGNPTGEKGAVKYDDILRDAQRLGFAESNPTLDVEGYDATFKTAILVAHAFGVIVPPENIVRRGISTVSAFDAKMASAHDYTIKLLASLRTGERGTTAWVMPALVPKSRQLASVSNEYNAVLLQAAFSDAQFMVGKGAGSHPTASAVLSDIAALRYAYRYEYKKIAQGSAQAFTSRVDIQVYVRCEDDDLLRTVPFSRVDIDYRSADGHYAIGLVNLEQLASCAAFGDKRVFIAAVLPE